MPPDDDRPDSTAGSPDAQLDRDRARHLDDVATSHIAEFVGLDSAEAERRALALGINVRIVSLDQAMLVHDDWRHGRINALTRGGVVIDACLDTDLTAALAAARRPEDG